VFLLGLSVRKPVCKPLEEEGDDQNIPHGSVYFAGIAAYITLGFTNDMDALVALLKTNANAANAFGALASAAAAFLALLFSCISIGISIWAASLQRRHNELTVRPLAEVTVADYENSPRRPPKVLHLWPPKLLHPGRGDLTH
jgi:hypothetical protein